MKIVITLIATMSAFVRAFPRAGAVGLLSASWTGKRYYVSAEPLKMTATDIPLTKNPLQQRNTLPLFSAIDASHVLPAMEQDLASLKDDFAKLEESVKSSDASYHDVVEKMEKIQFPLSYSWGVVSHLMGVKNSEELRKSHDLIQPKVIEVYQKIGQSQAVFQAVSKLKSNEELFKELEETKKRIIASTIRQMENSGVGLAEAEREKFNKLQQEAAELSTKFSNNVLDSTKAFKLLLTNKEDVTGLPASALGLAAQQAAAAGHEGATKEDGPWLISLDMPIYLPCMQHLKNRQLREQLYRAYVSRASTEDKDNVPIIKRILQIKQDMARMLGYTCHAEKSLAAKMAPSVDSVLELTEMLRQKSFPAAQRELGELKTFAASQGFTDEIALWDVAFWSERLREKMYEYEEEQLRPYFAMPKVLDGLFSLATRLFGVTIEPADGQAEVWNPDVRFFNIKDSATGDYIASFYLDPYSRPAEKRGGAWMDVCVGRSKVLGKKPVAYLVCNGSPPVGDSPSLMTFREVETLFHEFGHGLQHMLTKVEDADAAGINNIEWDAVELPSQFMENWCYDRPTLYGFASHYATGEPLPEELFSKIKAAKNFQAGMMMCRQLFFGAMDIKLHSDSYDPYGDKSPFEIQHELASKYTVIPPLDNDRFLCSFGHIFAGGYSAGYYSYKWAEVMSADAFAAFEEVGLDNEAAVRETGKRFRDTVLALGGGKHPSDVFKLFRGREPSPEALLRHSGLSE